MWKKRLPILAAILLSLLTIAASVWHYSFVNQTIYSESTAHLKEIYHQANQSLHNLVGRNWSTMHMWVPFIQDTEDEQKVADYISMVKEENGFTDFYFISREGEYYTIDGNTGYLDFKDSMSKLILEGKDALVNSVIPEQPEIMVFAVPIERGTYHNFEYEAIAISYNNSDLIETLENTAFDGKSSSFVVHSDGRVIVDSTNNKSQKVFNILAMLRKYSTLSDSAIKEIKNDFLEGRSGALEIRLDNEDYYFVYENVEFEDWAVIGIVPADVVNASMNSLQSRTLILVATIAVVVFIFMLGFVIRQNRSKLIEKDTEILYRDELFSTLSGNVDDIFLMIDAETSNVDYISPNVEKLIGISEEKVRANIRELDQVIIDGDSVKVLDQLENIPPEHQNEWDREYLHQNTGEARWFHVVALCRIIRDEKKYILVMSDRTKEKTANRALEDAVNLAQSANIAKSAFLSNMSHDIRTPMNAILGFTTLADANVGNDEKVKDYLTKIKTSGDHLLSLINDVLDMSRIESGKFHLEETDANLHDLLNDIKNIISGQVEEKQLTLHMDDSELINGDVVCDKTRLSQVVMNLLSNAIKFTTFGGEIFVNLKQLSGAEEGKGLYEFRVKDNGMGMSQDFAKRIFHPFERERNSTVSKIQGTGLGMSITKNIIDMMGGSIEVETEEGKGTEFIVRLELLLQSELKDQTKQDESIAFEDPASLCNKGINGKSKEEVVGEIRGKRLLLAEDNELNMEIAMELLSAYGFEMHTAVNGAEALEKVKASNPGDYDLILMDVQMPELNGYEATRRIRALEDSSLSTIPIVAMTANAFSEDRKKAEEYGMNGFVSKPINIEEVIKEIHRILCC
ncbi:MAG: ATP-binding protein [Firmicutes bacterium]|nr:ATP-binding protein [Bacillota bacterium]